RCAARGPDVDAGVELTLLQPGRVPVAELGGHGAPHGPPRRQRGQRPAGARHEPLERAQALGLLAHRLAQAVELVTRRQAGPLRIRLRRAADTPVAAPGSPARAERLPDLGLELAPARHRLTDLVEHHAVMAKLLLEEGGVAGERAQM